MIKTVSWKYDVPDVENREILALNKTELSFLEKYLPRDSDLWARIATHNLLEAHEDTE